jgi:hypothetical protein
LVDIFPASRMNVLVFLMVALAVIIDITSLVLGVRRLRGNGPSGTPLVGLLVFGIAIGIGYVQGLIAGDLAQQAVIGYAIFHLAANFGILLILHWLLKLLGK